MSYWQPGFSLHNGRYVIQKQLGEGGFGVTYLAKDRIGNLIVIKTLKQLLQQRPDYPKFKEDFYNEAIALAKCQHPHIVPVSKILIQGEFPCIVMDYIDGESLGDKIKNQGFIPEKEALRYITQIGEALILVHQNGLLHRDVKPQNIIIQSQNNKAVLIDFGIARYFQPDVNESLTSFRSFGYAPIEQYDARGNHGYHSDVYGLAATLYFILTNTTPTFAHLRTSGKGDSLIPPQQINPLITDKVNYAILKGMGIYPEERSPSIESWLSLLENLTKIQMTTSSDEKNNTNNLASSIIYPQTLIENQRLNEEELNSQKLNQEEFNNQRLNQEELYNQRLNQEELYNQRLNQEELNSQKLNSPKSKKIKLKNIVFALISIFFMVAIISPIFLGTDTIKNLTSKIIKLNKCHKIDDYKIRCESIKDVPIDIESGIQEITFGGSTTFAKVNTPEIINRIKRETNYRLPLEYKKLPGSSYGITQLIENRLHFAHSSLSITKEQIEIAAKSGFRLQSEIVAYNIYSIIVNPQLKEKLLKQLTLQQVRDIFTGKITNWKDVNGPDLKIKIIRRNPQDKTITTDLFQSDVLNGEKYGETFKFVANNETMRREMNQTPGSIAYNTFSQSFNSSDIRILPIAKDDKSIAVTPCLNLKCEKINRSLFQEEKYPRELIKPFYVVIKMNNGLEQKAGYAYVNIMLSNEGQKIIEDAGFLVFYNQP